MKSSGGIVVVGGMNMDIQGRSSRPFRPGDSNPGTATRSPGGVGRNIAENLVRLGRGVELVTVLGSESLCEELERSCAELGIGLSGSIRLAGALSSTYLTLFDHDGSLVGAIAAMDGIDALLPAVLAGRAELLDGADLIVVDANLPAESVAWLAKRYGRKSQVEGISSHRPLLALDPVSVAKAARAAPWIGAFDFAKPNLAEAAILAGAPLAARASYATLGQKLAHARELAMFLRGQGLGEAFISLGPDGLYAEGPSASGPPERYHARADPARAVAPALGNVSGAGDAACAALAWGAVARGADPRGGAAGDAGGMLPLRERAALAVAAALIASSSEKTVNPDMAEATLRDRAEGVLCEQLP